MAKRSIIRYKYTLDSEDLAKYKDRLRPEHYVVLQHRAMLMRYDEMSHFLSVPVGTIKSRMHRGITNLEKLKLQDANV